MHFAIVLLIFIQLTTCIGFRLTTLSFSKSKHRIVEMKSSKDKKSKPSSTPGESVSSSPARVTSNSNVPVRQQIAWARAYKRLMTASKSSGDIQTKKYRKEKSSKSQSDSEIGSDDVVDYADIKPPKVFVDGYNVIGVMKAERRNSDDDWNRIDFDDARSCLISDLSVLQGSTGWDIEVVFDAYKHGDSVGKQEVSDGIPVTYTSSKETADGYIERRVQELLKEGEKTVVVVTDDHLLRLAACNSSGSTYMPVASLLEEFRIAYNGWDLLEQEMLKSSQKRASKKKDYLSIEDLEKIFEQLRANPT